MQTKSLNTELMDAMYRMGKCMRQHMAFDSDIAQLTMPQMETLVFLKHHGITQMRDISDNFKITMPTATALLNRLVDLKLVTREHDTTDRRIVHVLLTKRGETLLTEATKQRSEKMNKILSFLSETDKQALLRVIETIISKTEQHTYEK